MKHADDENRWKQIAAGAGILTALGVLACGFLLGWRHLPGLLREWAGMIVGVLTTPFFLEATAVVVGLTVVLALNGWRRKRAGDEWVYLERADEAEARDMPEQAQWAVYQKPPLAGEVPSLLAQAEGAVAIGDFAAAADCLGAMNAAELKRPETLAVRAALAKATGKPEVAAQLEAEMRAAGGPERSNNKSVV